MGKAFSSILLLSSFLILCAVYPIKHRQEIANFLYRTQYAYEADHLAWEIKTYKKIDAATLPSQTIEFYCYNKNMEQETILTSADELDFSPYFCIVFEYRSEKRGVSLE